MKNSALLLLIACVISVSSAVGADSVTEKIDKALPSMTKKVYMIEGDFDEIPVKIYLNKKGEIKKIEIENKGEMGKTVRQYYMNNGKLSAVREKDFTYATPDYVEDFDISKSKIVKSVYYFKNGKMIRWIEEDKVVDPTSERFMERSGEIEESFETLMDAIMHRD